MSTNIYRTPSGSVYVRGQALRDLRRLACEYALMGCEYLADVGDPGDPIPKSDSCLLHLQCAAVAALTPHPWALRPHHRDPITGQVVATLTMACDWFNDEAVDIHRERWQWGETYGFEYRFEVEDRAELARRCRYLLSDLVEALDGGRDGDN